MTGPSTSARAGAPGAAPAFGSIACGVDGTRASYEAARQAAVLARDGGALTLLAVTWETGTLASRMVALSRRRAEDALAQADALAHDLGVRAAGAVVEGPHAGEKLLAAAGEHDLLVVGSSGRSHSGGLVLGHAADAVLRDAPVSVLVARRPPVGEFPAAILVAVDDPAALPAAGAAAGALAARFGSAVTVLAAPHHDAAERHAVAEAAAAVAAATGVEPVVEDARGRFPTAAAHAAAELGATLVVTAGRHAERVAECARCSVLVLRDP